jgi:hypothetical protein
MKSRLSALIVVVLVLGLGVLACWMWFGHTYRVRFKPDDLQVLTVVTYGRDKSPRLTVGFNNRSKGNIEVLKSPGLCGPFEVQLVSVATEKCLDRLPKSLQGPVGTSTILSPRSELSWTVPFSQLYGELPPGRYVVKVIYDTEAGVERGEKWADSVDTGKAAGPPIRFEVKQRAEKQ